jgi:TolB protein
MERRDKLLLVILVVLTFGVLMTGALSVYMALDRRREDGDAAGAAGGQQASGLAATGGPVAFAADYEGILAVYVIEADGSNMRRISPAGQIAVFPSWSPDGQRLAYVALEGETLNWEPTGVWVATLDGSEPVQIGAVPPNLLFDAPIWTPDGTLLALLSAGQPGQGEAYRTNVSLMRADGSGSEPGMAMPFFLRHVTMSPDGDEALLVTSTHPREFRAGAVYVMSIEDQSMTQIYDGAFGAAWSPDGNEVLVGDYNSSALIIVGQNAEQRVVAQLEYYPIGVNWSSDGTHVAVAASGELGGAEPQALYVVDIESGEITVLVDDEDGMVSAPLWSPDGRRLLFEVMDLSRERGARQIRFADLWVYDVESGAQERLTPGEGFAGLGVWSPHDGE